MDDGGALVVDGLAGEILPIGDRAGWTDDEWAAYIRAADPAEAIKAKARRIYEFATECPKCRGGSHFSEFMWLRFGMKQGAAYHWKRLGQELHSNAMKFDGLSITDDWHAHYELATSADEVIAELAKDGGTIDRKRIKAAKKAVRPASPARPVPDGVRCSIFAGDVRDIDALPAESVDVIITDPPYPHEYLPLYDSLAAGAARWLRPGRHVRADVSAACVCFARTASRLLVDRRVSDPWRASRPDSSAARQHILEAASLLRKGSRCVRSMDW